MYFNKVYRRDKIAIVRADKDENIGGVMKRIYNLGFAKYFIIKNPVDVYETEV